MKWISVKDKSPPRDGTPFLCYDPQQETDFENACIYVVRFENHRTYRNPGYFEAGGEGFYTWDPTHWMPLPHPPEKK